MYFYHVWFHYHTTTPYYTSHPLTLPSYPTYYTSHPLTLPYTTTYNSHPLTLPSYHYLLQLTPPHSTILAPPTTTHTPSLHYHTTTYYTHTPSLHYHTTTYYTHTPSLHYHTTTYHTSHPPVKSHTQEVQKRGGGERGGGSSRIKGGCKPHPSHGPPPSFKVLAPQDLTHAVPHDRVHKQGTPVVPRRPLQVPQGEGPLHGPGLPRRSPGRAASQHSGDRRRRRSHPGRTKGEAGQSLVKGVAAVKGRRVEAPDQPSEQLARRGPFPNVSPVPRALVHHHDREARPRGSPSGPHLPWALDALKPPGPPRSSSLATQWSRQDGQAPRNPAPEGGWKLPRDSSGERQQR